jgi:hypothetical protein
MTKWFDLDRAESDAVMAVVGEWVTLAGREGLRLGDGERARLAILGTLVERWGRSGSRSRVVEIREKAAV